MTIKFYFYPYRMADLNWIMIENSFLHDISLPIKKNRLIFGFDKEKIFYALSQTMYNYELLDSHKWEGIFYMGKEKKITDGVLTSVLYLHFGIHYTKYNLSQILKEEPDIDPFIVFESILPPEGLNWRKMEWDEMQTIDISNPNYQNIHPRYATILANYFNDKLKNDSAIL